MLPIYTRLCDSLGNRCAGADDDAPADKLTNCEVHTQLYQYEHNQIQLQRSADGMRQCTKAATSPRQQHYAVPAWLQVGPLYISDISEALSEVAQVLILQKLLQHLQNSNHNYRTTTYTGRHHQVHDSLKSSSHSHSYKQKKRNRPGDSCASPFSFWRTIALTCRRNIN
jgi:hypothetical protein